MARSEEIRLSRECDVIEIPSGNRSILPASTAVTITQTLGGSFTVASSLGAIYRIDGKDADALGLAKTPATQQPVGARRPFNEKLVWDQLKTVFDPEIPVNIVDLGLIYSCVITKLERGGHKIDIKMSITAPGCGMANVLKSEVESKLSRLPDVKEFHVEVVFDPPWNPGRMSEAARLQLGFDLDYGETPSLYPSPGGRR
jgi:probable FeS assembly SUF system protein SufT